jgi:hypothetical protein
MTCLKLCNCLLKTTDGRLQFEILRSYSHIYQSSVPPNCPIRPFPCFVTIVYRPVRQHLTYFLINADPRQRQLKRTQLRHYLGSGDGQRESSCCGKTRSKTWEYAVANILLQPPHVIPYSLSIGPPPIILPHNYPTAHPHISYTSFPLATEAADGYLSSTRGCSVRRGWILVIGDMRYLDLGRKNGEH